MITKKYLYFLTFLYSSVSYSFDYSNAIITEWLYKPKCMGLENLNIDNRLGSTPYETAVLSTYQTKPGNLNGYDIKLVNQDLGRYTGLTTPIAKQQQLGYIDEQGQTGFQIDCTAIGVMLNIIDYPILKPVDGGGVVANHLITFNHNKDYSKIWKNENDTSQLTVQVNYQFPWFNNFYNANLDAGFTVFFMDTSMPNTPDSRLLIGAGMSFTGTSYVPEERIGTDGNWDFTSSFITDHHNKYITKSPYSSSFIPGPVTFPNYKFFRFHISPTNMRNAISSINQARKSQGNKKPQLSTNISDYKLLLVLAGVEMEETYTYGIPRKGSAGISYKDLSVFKIDWQ